MKQHNGLTNHAVILNALNSPDRDWLLEGGLCEILPVGAAPPSVHLLPVPVARGWDLNYSRREKERRLTQAKQRMGAVS